MQQTLKPATKSYLIPVGDMTLTDRKNTRINCDQVLLNNALRTKIKDLEEDLLLRDTLPQIDLGLAAQDDWLVAGIGVLAVELQYTSFALPVDVCVGFYGVGVESAPPSISRVRLTRGAASTQIRGVFQLEQLYSRLETVGFFSEVVVFVRSETIRIMVMPRLAFAANTERLHMYARTVEPIGNVISQPSV